MVGAGTDGTVQADVRLTEGLMRLTRSLSLALQPTFTRCWLSLPDHRPASMSTNTQDKTHQRMSMKARV